MEKSFAMKNKFIMFVGLPGSGKSYLAKQLLGWYGENEMVWLSSDQIREELFGSCEEQGEPQEVFALMRTRTEKALKDGKTVLYDACNINSKKRRAFLNNIKSIPCEKICIICATPYGMCSVRNWERERNVPDEVIARMYKNWQVPCYFEGWDKIRIQYAQDTAGCSGPMEDFVRSLKNYRQDNPHHKETLGEHLKMTAEYLMDHYGYEPHDNIIYAAYMHDFGKPFTKEFRNSKGEATEIAHYYGHQHTGAYDAMFYCMPNKTEEDILEIISYICYHMKPFEWEEGKPGKKILAQWGEEFCEKLLQLHEADLHASIRA